MTTPPAEPTPIADLTFDALVEVLVAGETVLIAGTGEVFQLGIDSRVALAFYRRDMKFWGKYNVTTKEIEQLLEALKAAKVPARSRSSAAVPDTCRWRLRKITAHRFAGLHRHCNPDDGSPPPPFEWELDKDLSLIWGFNGAGKSSLLSAITWCLTGRALRSHKMPAHVHEPMMIEVPSEQAEAPSETNEAAKEENGADTLPVPPVVPIPSTTELDALSGEPVTNDTWVELVLEPVKGGNPIKVRRNLTKTKTGKYIADATGLDSLGLTELALQVGTIMPSIAAQMRFDEPTELGKAVAELTGLKPFSEFGKRCPRVIERLTGREVEESGERKAKLVVSFREKLDHYHDAISAHTSLKAIDDLILPGTSVKPSCRERIIAARNVTNTASEQVLACFDSILRERPSLDDETKVDALLAAIESAAKALGAAEVKILPTAHTRLAPLKALSEQPADIEAAEEMIAAIMSEAEELATRLADADKAKRWQLYARVAQWHQHHHPDEPFEKCPVCSTSLLEVPEDAALDTGIAEALEECRRSATYLTRTVDEWEKEKAETLLATLPKTVLNVIDHDWSKGLTLLYEQVLISEMLGKPEFGRVLAPLAENAGTLWRGISVCLPKWPAPELPRLPVVFPTTHDLELTLGKVTTALSVARFRHEHRDGFDGVIPQIVGKSQAGEATPPDAEDLARLPLLRQLFLLRQAASAARPAAKAIALLDGLISLLDKWEAEGTHVVALGRAAAALQPFCRFPELVEEQVAGLLRELAKGTETWVGRIYRPHYLGGPGFAGFGEGDGTALDLKVTFGGTIAAAHQVLNSSALRAHVWGFLLALWERVWASRGGLACVLLDDPQALFDAMNAENMAAAIPNMLAAEMRPIIVSNDNHFVAMATAYLRERNALVNSALLQLSPISSSKLSASLVPLVEKLREERARWREDENDVGKAQSFVEPVRAHVETRLWDLLASDPKPMFKPTLADLLGRIANARGTGQKPFNEEPFNLLLNYTALQPASDFYKVLNKAHHRPRDITPVDAKAVDDHFNSVENLIDACAGAYARFLGRLPDDRHAAVPTSPPPAPPCRPLPSPQLRVLPPLAARMDFTAIAESDVITEMWDPAEFGDIALFGIGAHTLGTACLMGQTAIVDVGIEPKGGDLVICQLGTNHFARRLGIDRGDPARLILESIPSATGRLPPTHIVPRYATRAMKIVGVLFDLHGGIQGEAALIEVSDILRSVRAIAPVVGASAYPVAPEGSRVLLTPVDVHDESELARLEGRIVAVAASDTPDTPDYCAGYLKRLGPQLAGFPAVRVLENIGSLGNSLHVHFPSVGDAPSASIASVRQMWRVNGVLY